MTTPRDINPLAEYQVTTRTNAASGSDTEALFVGPGVGTAPGVGTENPLQGFSTITGTRIFINETLGADTIELHHFTGAQILLDADGSIYLIPSSRKGFGLNSPRGDGLVTAQNKLVIKGAGALDIETDGDLNLNIGKNFYINVDGDKVERVKGSVNLSVDGQVINELASDVSDTIAGSKREVVAGRKWTQISGDDITDTGGAFIVRSENDGFIESKNKFSLISSDLLLRGRSNNIIEGNAIKLNSASTIENRSTGNFIVESGAEAKISSSGRAFIGGSTAAISGSVVNLRGSSVTSGSLPIVAGPGPESISIIAPEISNTAPSVPIVVTANTIIDSLTSARRYPNIQINLNRATREQISILQNEGGDVPEAAVREVTPNSGRNPQINEVPVGQIPDQTNTQGLPINAFRIARETSFPAPSSIFNPQERLSRNITVGMFPGIQQIPASFAGLSKREIIRNIQNLCFNILDPLWETFPGRVQITTLGGWRPESRNHNSGRAVDIRSVNRNDYAFSAELASYIRDNLPYSKILLERNNYGTIHVHVESQQPGGYAGGTILTCSDPQCRVSTPGIQLSFATASLRQRNA